jgi:ubiquinone/menaquinone biosynthesis C-methylase UbiE
MKQRMRNRTPGERFCASPAFYVAFDFDGRPYAAMEVEPYTQYWLSDRYQRLHAMFGSRRGSTIRDAVEAYMRSLPSRGVDRDNLRTGLERAAAKMRAAGLLVGATDEISRYDKSVVADYVHHRAFPTSLARLIAREGKVRRGRKVLEVAGGPGDLALALAAKGADVALMDLSRGFLRAAGDRARARGLTLQLIHDSGNRLLYRNEEYDVVTISQALHWLDDVAFCRGLYRVLRPGASFFVVHARTEVRASHPLARLFSKQAPFQTELRALVRRLTLLFDALDPQHVSRVDFAHDDSTQGATSAIVLSGAWMFRQRRPMPIGFARAFMTARHVEQYVERYGEDPAMFWPHLEARYAAAKDVAGDMHWAVLHFQRGGRRRHVPIRAGRFIDR